MNKQKKYSFGGYLPEKTFAAIFILALTFFVNGCDTCNSGSGPGDGEGTLQVYFTALPLNGTTPAVYRIKPDGSGLREIIPNATIYSAPSDNGLIAFIRKEGGEAMLYTSSIEGDNIKFIEKDNPQFSIAYPVLSPDGEKIAFFGGDAGLLVYKLNNFSVEKVSGNFLGGSLPSFSSDGTQLAFFENVPSNEFTVRIVDANLTENTLFSKTFAGNIDTKDNEPTVRWAENSIKIVFGFSLGGIDKIAVIEPGIKENVMDFNSELPGAVMPDISNDDELICFSSSNGEILARNVEGEPQFSTLTENSAEEKYLHPDWAPKDNYILVNRYYSSESTVSNTDIMVLKIVKNGSFAITDKSILLSNNAYRAFWKIK